MLINYFQIIFITLISIQLISCSSLFESDNQEPPVELIEYEQQLDIKILWNTNTGNGNEGQALRLIPIFNENRLFVANQEGEVLALDAKNGETIWNTDVQAQLSSGPSLGINQIIVGTNKAEVIALAEDDGHELWRVPVSSQVAAISRGASDIIVIHTVDGKIHALIAETGEKKWLHERTEPALTLHGGSSPLIDRGTVIVGLSNGMLINLDVATGQPYWETTITQSRGRSELERIVDIDVDPIIQDNLVYAATYQGDIAGVDQATGVINWRRKMSVYANMALDSLRLYVTDAKSRVWALYLQDGIDAWQQEALLNRRLTAPAILDNYVLVGDLDGYVHFLSRDDGSQQARIDIGSSPLTVQPLVVNDIAYIYSDDGDVTAISIL